MLPIEKTDPRLADQLRKKVKNAPVDALLLFVFDLPQKGTDKSEQMEQIIQQVVPIKSKALHHLRLIPAFHIAILKGENHLIQKLIKHPNIVFASATDISSVGEMW